MKDFFKNIGLRAFESIRGELIGVAGFIGAIWVGFILDTILGGRLSTWFDLQPRMLSGLTGVVGMPFLHADLSHILSNTFPLFILLSLLAGSRAKSARIVASLILIGGVVSWLGLRGGASYVGASVLVFALIGFLIGAGFLDRKPIPLLIAIIVGVMYGWTTIMGVLPLSSHVSELAHFYGLISGVGLAYVMSITDQGKADGPLAKSLENIVS